MKRLWFVILLAVLLVVCFALAGCSKSDPAPQTNPDPGTNEPEVEAGGLVIPDEYKMLRDVSGPSGGLWYTLGVTWGEVVKKDYGITFQCEPGGGGTINYPEVSADPKCVGFTVNPVIYGGLTGEGFGDGVIRNNVRCLFPLYPSIGLWWTLSSSGIKTIYDIEDKVVCLGAAGGTHVDIALIMFEILDIHPREIVYMSYSDATTALKDGTIDVLSDTSGHPHASLTELESNHEVTIIDFPIEASEKVLEGRSFMSLYTITADKYKSLDHDIQMIGWYSVACCNAELPDDIAYAITKAAYDNYDTIVTNVAAAKELTYENVKNLYGPMHPGAIRYYEEVGVEIPEECYPSYWDL